MMRFTVVEVEQAISFVAPPTALAILVSCCARDPQTIEALLTAVEGEDRQLIARVRSGLAVFDEHNAYGNYLHIHAALRADPKRFQPVFRVVDEVTRAASLQPFQWGVVVFNVAKKRIIQVQNTYAEVRREGHVPTFPEESVDGRQRVYRLPAQWRIVP
jgi:hypothetical protein